MRNRRNKNVYAPMEVYLVASGNQTLAGVYASGTVTVLAKASLTDGQTITLDDGVNTVIFELDVAGDGVSGSNVAVDVSGDTTATEVGDTFEAAVNAQNTAGNLNLTASNAAGVVTLTNTVKSAAGNVTTWASTNTTINGNIVQPTGGVGDLVGSGTALNIADQQLGVISVDHNGEDPYGNFLSDGRTVNEVNAVQLVQGTPKSGAINTVDLFHYGHRSSVKTGKIEADKILSVATYKYTPGRNAIKRVHTIGTPAASTDYVAYLQIESARRDRDFGSNRDILTATCTTPASATSQLDYLLQNLAAKWNTESTLLDGNRPIVVLGIKRAGGAGTQIGPLTSSDTVPFMTWNGQTYSLSMTTEIISALQTGYAADNSIANSTVEVIDLSTAGAAAKVDELFVIGLDEATAVVDDNIPERKTRLRVTLDEDLTHTVINLSKPLEAVNTGRKLKLRYDDKAGLQIFNMQNHPHGEYFVIPPSYITESSNYTVTFIEYVGEDLHISGVQDSPKLAVIVLPAAISNPNGDVDGTPFTVTTTATNTVAGLNSSLGAWLKSASNTYNAIKYLGAATKDAPFV